MTINETKPRSAETAAVRTGIAEDPGHNAVTPPIHLSSTYAFEHFGATPTFDYSRSSNPTRAQLQQALARLEGGAAATVTASGMAALTTLLQLVASDQTIIAPHDCYAGTRRLLNGVAGRGGPKVTYIDQTDIDAVAAAMNDQVRLLLIETPSNPLLRIADIAALCALAKKRNNCLTVVDNTFLSPANQRPLDLGADAVVHSTTKFLNGHSDVVGGTVICKTQAMGEDIAWWANCLGVTGSAFDSYLTLRGLRTLFIRARQAESNAAAIVERLQSHPAVEAVFYPGLDHHPGHEIARAQQSGYGAMVSFRLAGGLAAVEAFVNGLEIFTLAESLGGIESLVAHPATMTHAAMTAADQAAAGIDAGLLRLSVGIEAATDLLADLEAGLSRAGASG